MENKDFSWYPPMRYLLRKDLLLKIFKQNGAKGKSVLEIGYGAGDMLRNCSLLGMQVHGYDFSEQAREYAEYWLKLHDIHNCTIYVQRDDIFKQSYDFVLACEVLEHIEEDVAQLAEWRALLNERGKLMITVPAHMKKWGSNDVWAGHLRRYEKPELYEKLTRAGYQVDLIWSFPVPYNLLVDWALERSCRKRLEIKKGKSIEELTKESGLHYETNPLYKILSKEALLWPMMLLQKAFLNTELGSQYLVLASKSQQ